MRLLKLTALQILAVIVNLHAFGAEPAYKTEANIPYYGDAARESDPYIKERCKLDIYYPTTAKGFATLVWFHGGGLVEGSKSIPQGLKDKGLCVVAVNYRLSPRAKSPAYVEDAAAAVAWVFNSIENYGGSKTRIFVSGHSAGGYLTSMVGLDKQWLAKHKVDANRIAGLIPLSGQTITHFTIRKERGIPKTTPVVDEMAPVKHVRADAPPLLLITGDRKKEMEGRYEENESLMRQMQEAGHKGTRLKELKGKGHAIEDAAMPLVLQEIRRVIADQQ